MVTFTSICLYAFLSFNFSVHPIDFTLGAYIAEDPRKHGAKIKVVWTSCLTFSITKSQKLGKASTEVFVIEVADPELPLCHS